MTQKCSPIIRTSGTGFLRICDFAAEVLRRKHQISAVFCKKCSENPLSAVILRISAEKQEPKRPAEFGIFFAPSPATATPYCDPMLSLLASRQQRTVLASDLFEKKATKTQIQNECMWNSKLVASPTCTPG